LVDTGKSSLEVPPVGREKRRQIVCDDVAGCFEGFNREVPSDSIEAGETVTTCSWDLHTGVLKN